MAGNGGKPEPKTAICTIDETSVVIRGAELCRDLMGKMSFTSFFCFLLTGKPPTEDQAFFIDAALLAIGEHGLTTSVKASRMTFAAAPDCLQGAVAAGILGCGTVVLGTAGIAGNLLREGIDYAAKNGLSYAETADIFAKKYKAEKRRLPGFGHQVHKPVDPRCERLLQLADERGVAGSHVAFARELQKAAERVFERPMIMNVSAAIPAVLLDLDFPLPAMKGIPILARTASILGHLLEETQRPMGFQLSERASRGIAYDGPKLVAK
jgi:citrate synthase